MISIIVTIYNSEKFLKEALDSIVSQTYKDYEVIMVNDGSTDSSRAIAFSYTSDSRFILIDSSHIGFPRAKNLGLSNAHGDYIIFLDSDDIAHPQWLELLIKSILENNADISYCSYTHYYGEKIVNEQFTNCSMVDMTYQKMCPLFYPGCRNYMWNKLIKRELYDNIVFEDCISMSDAQVMYKIFDKATKVYQVKVPLVYYRRHSDSMSVASRHLLSYWKYRLEVMLDELTFVYDKYDISKFICRRTMESELYKLRTRVTVSEYDDLYLRNKDRIEHILYDSYECNFDVDLVVPYVDNRDPVWQKSYMDLTRRKDFLNNSRFDNPDLFEYFLRGVDKFMPWVRKIHLIVSNIEQVPSYINKDKTHIVLHEDIMPESILPTFNSSTIEMFISNIEGLSEHFIYANDDMYPISPMRKSVFFDNEGKPKIVFKNHQVNDDMSFFGKLCLNVYNHTAEAMGHPYDNKTYLRPEHTMAAFVLSHCKDCFLKMKPFIEQDLGPFRNVKQHTQYMYSLYEKFTNGYVFGGPSLKYHALNEDHDSVIREIKYRASHVLCLNGVADGEVDSDQLVEITRLLRENLIEGV